MSDQPGEVPIAVATLGRGRYEVVDGTRRQVAFAVTAGAATWVFLDGRVFVVESKAFSTTDYGDHGHQMALAAPMAATVTSVLVTPGMRVAQGEVVIVLEAMKMEVPIRAPRDGRVRSIGCQVGDLVQPGVALLELV